MAAPSDTHALTAPPGGLPGALWLYRFDGDGRAHPCDAATCDAGALRQPPGDDWHWLHLDLSDVRSAQIVALLVALDKLDIYTLLVLEYLVLILFVSYLVRRMERRMSTSH